MKTISQLSAQIDVLEAQGKDANDIIILRDLLKELESRRLQVFDKEQTIFWLRQQLKQGEQL